LVTGQADPAVEAPEDFAVYVIFLKEPVGGRSAAALEELQTSDDRFNVREREVVWWRRGRLTDATVDLRALEGALGGRTSTRRKLATVEKLLDRFGRT
jgi:hypothetical protein